MVRDADTIAKEAISIFRGFVGHMPTKACFVYNDDPPWIGLSYSDGVTLSQYTFSHKEALTGEWPK